ncbi:MAG: RMD1 family protein [Myxococcota bacterium]
MSTVPAAAPEMVSLVTVALDRPLDLRRHPPPGAEAVPGIPGGMAVEEEPRIYLFAFGAAVVQAPALDPALVERLRALTGAEVLRDTEETWSVHGAPGAPRAGWDRIHLPELAPHRVAMVAQSAALDRYDARANRLLDEALTILTILEKRNRLPGSPELTRRIAGITASQLHLSRSFFLVDRPDLTWEDAMSARVFDALYEHLELEERHAAVIQKLDSLSSALRTVADLQSARRGLQLELAIVALIVVEVVMALWQTGH